MMKYIFQFVFILSLVWGFGFSGLPVYAENDSDNCDSNCAYALLVGPYVNNGYTCVSVRYGLGFGSHTDLECTKTTSAYSATKLSAYALQGSYYTSTDKQTIWVSYWEKGSPFIYLHNAPAGEITVRLDSDLDSYSPSPLFTHENEWQLTANDSVVSLQGEEIDHLFYELELKKITLNRNGMNFASKDEVITYLTDSDFLTKLGFSGEEKDNSLSYLVPKIQSAADTEYYYLSVLDAASVAEISTLDITPKPNRIDRQYFSVYPTNVPVHTEGEFVFPILEEETGFTVKETGEFLINPNMFVFFK